MEKSRTYHRKKIVIAFFLCVLLFAGLTVRVSYLMIFRSEHYSQMAQDLHQRERRIKAKRGRILDSTGAVLADNRTVCTISVIHNQIRDPENVIRVLAQELNLTEESVRKRVEKVSSIEKIKSNVPKETGDAIRAYRLEGVKVDEDYKRYYPYGTLASKVLGFTGADNQGILALESSYEEYLKGKEGIILETTDARGVEIVEMGEERVEPQSGDDLVLSMDVNIQQYATKGQGGPERFHFGHASRQRGDPGHGGCAGVRSQRSVHSAAAGAGGRTAGRAEPNVAQCLHQRHLRTGIGV